jgi:hypothetical protein
MYLGPFLIALIALAAATSCQGPGPKTTPQTTEPASGFVFTAAGDYGSSTDTTANLDLKSTYLE